MASCSPPFKKPLGLVLSGGGALAAWQIGALAELEERLGPVFDGAIGFSAGALNAAAYAFGRLPEALERWTGAGFGFLRPSPRLRPLSLFSDAPLRRAIEFLPEDGAARSQMRSRLVVVSARCDRGGLVHGVFEPGQGRWDGPLRDHLLASCAIPRVFPPVALNVEGRRLAAFDGGVPCGEPMALAALGRCEDVLVLEMVREEELAARPFWPWQRVHLENRAICRRLIDATLCAALCAARGPRVFRLAPSRRLEFEMLHFRRSAIRGAIEQGRRDAAALLAEPARFVASEVRGPDIRFK